MTVPVRLHVVGPGTFLPPVLHLAETLGDTVWRAKPARTLGGTLTEAKDILGRGYQTVIYHDGWGLEFMHTGDGAQNRAVFVHNNFPFLDRAVPQWLRYCGTVLFAQPELATSMLQRYQWIPSKHLIPFSYPALDLHLNTSPAHDPDRPLRLGLAGWVLKRRQRLDLWPDFLRALSDAGIAVDVQVLGEGSGLPWLRRALRQYNVEFTSCSSLDEFRHFLHHIDLMVSFSTLEESSWVVQQARQNGIATFTPQLEGRLPEAALLPFTFKIADASDAVVKIHSWLRSGNPAPSFPQSVASAENAFGLICPTPQRKSLGWPSWWPTAAYNVLRDYWLSGSLRA